MICLQNTINKKNATKINVTIVKLFLVSTQILNKKAAVDSATEKKIPINGTKAYYQAFLYTLKRYNPHTEKSVSSSVNTTLSKKALLKYRKMYNYNYYNYEAPTLRQFLKIQMFFLTDRSKSNYRKRKQQMWSWI